MHTLQPKPSTQALINKHVSSNPGPLSLHLLEGEIETRIEKNVGS
jgi:hypothetical protein